MPVWLRIILWSEAEEENLKQAGLIVKDADGSILYLNFTEYSKSVRSVIT